MDSTAAVLVGVAVAVAVALLSLVAFRISERQQSSAPEPPEPAVPPGVAAVLSVLRSSALVVDCDDTVLKASAPAYVMGLVREASIAVPELSDLVGQVRRDGQIRETEFEVPEPGGPLRRVDARVAPLGSRLVLVLAEDRTRERRVEEIRRDFVANVSHELKTPLGAISLLAEAVEEAADDPVAVRRFADRMRTESARLTELVSQIIDLSRLQGDDPVERTTPVSVAAIVRRAVDRVSVDAEERGVDVHHTGHTGPDGIEVLGDEERLVTALGNLVENAVTYSPPGGTVRIDVSRTGTTVDIAVTDEGPGIPASELERIFERFYRTDPARARATGGTGLGLSIVKHVAATHGGRLDVRSTEGVGSTFTLSLPAAGRGSATASVGESATPPLAASPDTVSAGAEAAR